MAKHNLRYPYPRLQCIGTHQVMVFLLVTSPNKGVVAILIAAFCKVEIVAVCFVNLSGFFVILLYTFQIITEQVAY
jgi:hypothetical protein